MGFIYILTNPSFPAYVKIGYADDVEQRLRQFNQSECVPFAFRVYATYEVQSRLQDQKLHRIIDTLNPTLRAAENFNGRERKKEFYAISKEDAYSILYAIAEINGLTDKIKLWEMNDMERQDEIEAEKIEAEHVEKLAPFQFSMCGIEPGEKITWCYDETLDITVLSDKKVQYNGVPYSLSGLAAHLLGKSSSVGICGPSYFRYDGEILSELRRTRCCG